MMDVGEMIRGMVANQSVTELFDGLEMHRDTLEIIKDLPTGKLRNMSDEQLSLAWTCVVVVLKEVDGRVEARRLRREELLGGEDEANRG